MSVHGRRGGDHGSLSRNKQHLLTDILKLRMRCTYIIACYIHFSVQINVHMCIHVCIHGLNGALYRGYTAHRVALSSVTLHIKPFIYCFLLYILYISPVYKMYIFLYRKYKNSAMSEAQREL